jgi:hypothetical protein
MWRRKEGSFSKKETKSLSALDGLGGAIIRANEAKVV